MTTRCRLPRAELTALCTRGPGSLAAFDRTNQSTAGCRQSLVSRKGRPPEKSGRRGPPPGGQQKSPAPDARLLGNRPGDSLFVGPENDTALLQTVLTFYERFAQGNETNPRLQGEAAWAYFKVGSLCERLDRPAEAKQSIAHAVNLLENLVARFPGVPEYRSRLVQIAIMTDPWSVDPQSLEPLEARLRKARTLIDQLAAQEPQKAEHIQDQIHVHAKLGTVFERRGQPEDALACYQRAIDLAGTLIERSPGSIRPGSTGPTYGRLWPTFSRRADFRTSHGPCSKPPSPTCDRWRPIA